MQSDLSILRDLRIVKDFINMQDADGGKSVCLRGCEVPERRMQMYPSY